MNLLPVELVQDIIRYLPRGEQLTFSLLSKRSRAVGLDVALSTINMNGQNAVDGWPSLSDDFKKLVVGRCRSLSCTINNIRARSLDPHDNRRYYANFSTQHLSDFEQLTSLHLVAVHLNDRQLINSIQPHIKELKLDNCSSTLNGFATLINNFPELTHLTLINIKYHQIQHELVAPHLPPQSLRKLFIADVSLDIGFFRLLDWIFSVPWDDVSVLEGKGTRRLKTQQFIGRASANVKRLDLQENLCHPYRERRMILP